MVECKLGAKEGSGQFAKYMNLDVWGVTAIASKRVTPPKQRIGRKGARWLAGSGDSQFYWSDIHALATAHAAPPTGSVLTRSLATLLKTLKLDPPHAEVGRFGRGGSPKEQEQRAAFRPNWKATLPLLAKLGWPEWGPGKQAQIYTGPRDGPRRGRRIEHALLNPLVDEGRTLRVRLNGYSDKALVGALRNLNTARLPHNAQVTREIRTVQRKYGPAQVLDVDVPMSVVLPAGVTAEERATALATFVGTVLRKAG